MKKKITKTKRGKTAPSMGKRLVGAGGLLNIAAALNKQIQKADADLSWKDKSKGFLAMAQKEDGGIDFDNLFHAMKIQKDAGAIFPDHNVYLCIFYAHITNITDDMETNDKILGELYKKMIVIRKREGLKEDDCFDLDSPKTPKDWLALNEKYDIRLDKITADVMRNSGENEIADLYLNDRKTFNTKIDAGLQIWKNDPEDKKNGGLSPLDK